MATRKQPYSSTQDAEGLDQDYSNMMPQAGAMMDPSQIQGAGPAPVAVPPPATTSSLPLGSWNPMTLPTGDEISQSLFGFTPDSYSSGAGARPPEYPGRPGSPENPYPDQQTPPATGGDYGPYEPDVPHTVIVDGAPEAQGPGGWGMPDPQRTWTRDQVRDWVAGYYNRRKTSPFPTSIDYWTDKFFSPEFNGDIQYWMSRLAMADEFGGGYTGGGEVGGTSGDLFGMDLNSLIQSLFGMGGTSTAMPKMPNFNSPDLAKLRALLYGVAESGGQFNTDIVNRRVQGARDDMNRNRSSQLDSLRAQLADRGLIGEGPEISGMYGVEEELANLLNQQVSDIYAGESQNADDRMMGALGQLGGLASNEAANNAAAYNAQTSRYSVDRNADTQKLGQMLDYILGLGGLGIQNSRLQLDADLGYGGLSNDAISQLIEAVKIMFGGAGQAQGGFR